MNLRPPPPTINDAPKVNRFARASNGNQGLLHDDGYAVSGIIVNKLVSFQLCQLHNDNLYLLTTQ